MNELQNLVELLDASKTEHILPNDNTAEYNEGYVKGMNVAMNRIKELSLFSVSGTVGLEDAKKVLLRYDQAIKEEIAVKLEWLRDHGTHAEFCDIITDIRENVLDTYR